MSIENCDEAWEKWHEDLYEFERLHMDLQTAFEGGWNAREDTIQYLIGVLEDITTFDKTTNEVVAVVSMVQAALEKMDEVNPR